MVKIILGGLLALIVLSGMGLCETAKMPASADLYVNLKSLVTYNSDVLRCDTGCGNVTNFTAVQFDISGLNLSDSDIALLTLKASSMQKSGTASDAYYRASNNTSSISSNETLNDTSRDESSNASSNGTKDIAGLVAVPISSTWSEFSGTNGLLMSLLPSIESLLSHGINLHQVGICLSEEGTRSFDVTRDVKEAKARGDSRISFLLGAFSNGEYKAEFKSRETGQGPYLLIISYPQEDQSALDQDASPSTSPDSKPVSNQDMPTPFSVRMKESSSMNGPDQGQAENSTSISVIKQREVQKSLDFMAAKVSDSMPSTTDVQPAISGNDTLQIGLDL
ncbi:MAG TPA: hypothetical protein VN455_12545 [Methanotrichaceae archaeon]|nr:hypothetical protein [Methanotrichaceae archaeon]